MGKPVSGYFETHSVTGTKHFSRCALKKALFSGLSRKPKRSNDAVRKGQSIERRVVHNPPKYNNFHSSLDITNKIDCGSIYDTLCAILGDTWLKN